jgi:hypothetical protein
MILNKHYHIKFRIFLDVAPFSRVEVDRRFRGAYYLHHQGDECSLSTEVYYVRFQVLTAATMKFRVFWRWRQYVPMKLLSTSTWLHGDTSKQTLNFMLAAVRTQNLIVKIICFIKLYRISSKAKDVSRLRSALINSSPRHPLIAIQVMWYLLISSGREPCLIHALTFIFRT